MLVLGRAKDEQIIIGKDAEIVVTVLDIRGTYVRLGIDAPKDVTVHRKEVWDEIKLQEAYDQLKKEADRVLRETEGDQG